MNFIAFPGLGIKWMIDPVAFAFGPFTVRWYGIMLSLAIFSTLLYSLRHAPRYGIAPDSMVDMFMFALPVSVLFARLYFVLVEWDSFKDDLLGMFRIWEGGITIYGAVFGAVLTVYVFCRVRKYKMWEWVDFACVYLPLAQAIGRFGNFFNQELYGGNTTLPWGMTGSLIQAYPNPGVDGNLPVHPTFLYEALWNLVVFAILMKFRPRSMKRGQVFAAYLFLYSIGRFGMEFIRTDVFSAGDSTLRANMIAAGIIAAVGILLFILRGRTTDSPWVPISAAVADRADLAVSTEVPETAPFESDVAGHSAYGQVLRNLREQEIETVSRAEAEVDAAVLKNEKETEADTPATDVETEKETDTAATDVETEKKTEAKDALLAETDAVKRGGDGA